MDPSGFSGVKLSSHSAECPVPALFQPLELSSPGFESFSNTVISHSGTNSFNNAAKVADIIPPPIRITSVFLGKLLIIPFLTLVFIEKMHTHVHTSFPNTYNITNNSISYFSQGRRDRFLVPRN